MLINLFHNTLMATDLRVFACTSDCERSTRTSDDYTGRYQPADENPYSYSDWYSHQCECGLTVNFRGNCREMGTAFPFLDFFHSVAWTAFVCFAVLCRVVPTRCAWILHICQLWFPRISNVSSHDSQGTFLCLQKTLKIYERLNRSCCFL